MAREFLFGSPIATALNTDAAETATLTVSEPSVLDFSRILTYACFSDDIVGYAENDLTEAIQMTSLLWNGAEQLIRGRNTAAAPGSAFSPQRLGNIIDLGEYNAATADTLLAEVTTTATNVAGGFFNFAVPGTTRNRRDGYTGPIPQGRVAYAASPVSEVAAGASADITLTADADCILDLSNMVITCTLDQPVNLSHSPGTLSALAVTQITLPSGDKLILGQNTPSAAAEIWRVGRQMNWVDFGFELVQGGSTVVLSITNNSADIANIAWGCQMFPTNGKGIC